MRDDEAELGCPPGAEPTLPAPHKIDVDVDIGALLSATLDPRPSDAMSEGVMMRMAAVTTVMEFIRLVGVAPFHWLLGDAAAAKDDDDDHDFAP